MNMNGGSLIKWLPTIITVAAILTAWGAWKGAIQAKLQGINSRVDKVEAIAINLPVAYMPRGESDARLKAIDDKLSMMLSLLQSHTAKEDRP